MKCFYHDDMDGRCAGAIVYKFFGEGDFFRINYKDDFPFDKIMPGEMVVIEDFSLQKDGEFERLLQITDKVIWIDHHKTAIEKHKNLEYLHGIRQDGIAGCELTWKHFYPDVPVPTVVQMLGDYDIWAFKYGEKTNFLQTGIRLYDTNPKSEMWNYWLNPDCNPIEEIEAGKIALKYRNGYYAGLVKSWSFLTEFEGYKVIACNAGSVSSQLFDTITDDYDLMMSFCFDGKQWTLSIYTKKDDIDCSELAKKNGGGGHRKAAGFQCKELPFKKF
jgi:oligoribonuclease NrnB/cAMP/cGMP phosphodiesterase (DHH superfamily)